MSALKKNNDGFILLLMLLLIALTIGFASVFSGDQTPISDFLYAQSDVEHPLKTGEHIIFSENKVFSGIAVTHIPNSADILLNEKGVYEVTYSLEVSARAGNAPVKISLRVDGGEYISSETDVKQNCTITKSVLIQAFGGETISIKNERDDMICRRAEIAVVKIR